MHQLDSLASFRLLNNESGFIVSSATCHMRFTSSEVKSLLSSSSLVALSVTHGGLKDRGDDSV